MENDTSLHIRSMGSKIINFRAHSGKEESKGNNSTTH